MLTMQEVVDKIYKKSRVEEDVKSSIIAVIDFRKPSNVKRMQIIEMNERKILLDTYVAHGSNTGGLYATKFSNIPESHQTSLGVYKTGGTYDGKYGRSLILIGLEKGFNDKARQRSIVMHKSTYIGGSNLTGRSWGCFSLPARDKDKAVDLLKNGHLIIAYYPDNKWLSNSTFLK